VKVVEFAGMGPVPFCGMLLADMGADVLRVDRRAAPVMPHDVSGRGKRSLELDLRTSEGTELALTLVGKADVVLEGFRPGVMEKLGLGPDVALARNGRLIYGRMTGWGQTGPLANAAGHDINYIALTGALASVGSGEGPPLPPLNLVGDYGGGALYLALGVVSALVERARSGKGQVIDAAMVDGASSLMSLFTTLSANGIPIRRGENFLGGDAHFYRTYRCRDGRYVAIGAIEPHFYALLWEKLGAAAPAKIPGQDRKDWTPGAQILARIFETKTRAEWCALLDGTDVCFAPVLEFDEAPKHDHLRARGVYVDAFGVTQVAPAPRFSRTPGAIHGPPPAAGEGGSEVLADWGIPTRSAE
jgi:alpha-methylacyl-CoA racemase